MFGHLFFQEFNTNVFLDVFLLNENKESFL